MNIETMIHINETLSEQQRIELLSYLGNRQGAVEAHHHAADPHLIFVTYDPDKSSPHNLIEVIEERGLHAQLVDM